MGKVVLISSEKSDIGKTIICTKLGIVLSESNKNVLLIDLSFGKNKISEYLNVQEDIIYDIKDVLDNTCSLDQAIIEVSDKLSLLPYPRILDKFKDIKIESFTRLINESKSLYDVIIVDIDKISLSYIDFNVVDNIISVNNNDFSCIKEFSRDKHIAQKFNVDIITAVLNKFNNKSAKKGMMMNAKDIQKMTEMNMNIIIEENSKYSNADCDFMFSKEENSFNKAIKIVAEKF